MAVGAWCSQSGPERDAGPGLLPHLSFPRPGTFENERGEQPADQDRGILERQGYELSEPRLEDGANNRGSPTQDDPGATGRVVGSGY